MTVRASSRTKRAAYGFDDAAPTMKMSPVTSTAAHALVGDDDGTVRPQSGVWSVTPIDPMATLQDVPASSPDALATWKHDVASTWVDAVPVAPDHARRAPAPRAAAAAPRAVVSSRSMPALLANGTISPDGTLMPWGDVPVAASRRGAIVSAFLLTVAALVVAGFGLAWTAESVAVTARVAHTPAPGVRHLQLVNSAESKVVPPSAGRLAHRTRFGSRSTAAADESGSEGLAD